MAGAVQVLSIALSVVSTALLGVLTYYAKGRVEEIDKNTALRQYLVGAESIDADDGAITDLEDVHEEMQQEHREVRSRLQELSGQVGQLREAINEADAIDAQVEGPDSAMSD